MTFSIVIPTYNRRHLLGDAIERAYAHECEIRRLMQPGWR